MVKANSDAALSDAEAETIAAALRETTGSGNGGDPGPEQPGPVGQEQQTTLTIDDFRELSKIIPDTAFALTGRDLWLVPDREIEVLARSLERFWRVFVKFDPRLIVAGTFLMHGFQVIGTRAIAHAQIALAERRAKKHEAPKEPAA